MLKVMINFNLSNGSLSFAALFRKIGAKHHKSVIFSTAERHLNTLTGTDIPIIVPPFEMFFNNLLIISPIIPFCFSIMSLSTNFSFPSFVFT